MTRSPDSLIPSDAEQSAAEKRDDKAFTCRQGGEANLRATTEVNAVSASLTPPVSRPTQLELFPGRACVPEAKPATVQRSARPGLDRRDGVSGGGTQRQRIKLTGETLFGPAENHPTGREAYKVAPESAVTKPGRESEVAAVPMKFGTTGPREGPLLSSSGRNRERLPDCPREGRLNPGGSQRSAKRPSGFRKPANCHGRYTEWQSNNLKGGSHFSTIRFVGRTSCARHGNG